MGEDISPAWVAENVSGAPRYIEHIEGLYGMHFFPDEDRAEALTNDFTSLSPEDIAPRVSAYIQGLRILARNRWLERTVVGEPPPGQDEGDDGKTAEDGQSWNDRWLGQLTTSGIAHYAKTAPREVQAGIDELCVADLPESADEYGRDKPRLYQQYYVQDTMAKMNEAVTIEYTGADGRTACKEVRGVSIIGPTGSGKTVIMGELAHRLGIGKPGNDKTLQIVVPSTQLKNQLAGRTGDRTFLRFAPEEMTVSVCDAKEADTRGDTIIVTTDMYVKGYRQGHLLGKRIDYTFMEEGHHLTEPRVQQTFLEENNGQPVIALTATPDYNPNKDVRGLLPHTVDYLSLAKSIEKKIVNGAQLFTVLVDCHDIDITGRSTTEIRQLYQLRRNEVAQKVLAPLIAQGRRVMDFCAAGGKAAFAKDMAVRLAQVPGPDGTPITAKALHTYQKESEHDKIIKAYHAGDVQALTTVLSGVESLNIDVDVIAVNSMGSILKLRQIIGRGLRRSSRFEVTIFIQFLTTPPHSEYAGTPVSLYEAFGLEHVEQGVVLGATSKDYQYRKKKAIIDISVFPSELQAGMRAIEHKILSELILGRPTPRTEAPPGYIRFSDLAVPPTLNDRTAKYRLDHAGFTWVGVFEKGTGPGMTRYYEPAARHFDFELDKKFVDSSELMSRYGVGYRLLMRLIKDAPIRRVSKREGESGSYVRRLDLPILDAYVEEVAPLAKPGDLSAPALAAELGMQHQSLLAFAESTYGFKPKLRRVVARQNQKDDDEAVTGGNIPRFSKEEADILRADREGKVLPTDRTKKQICKDLGLEESVFNRALTEEESDWLTLKWGTDAKDRSRRQKVWTADQAEEVKRRVRERLTVPLPPHMLPAAALNSLIYANLQLLVVKVNAQEDMVPETARLKLGFNARIFRACYTWQLVRRLASTHIPKPDAPQIDYDRLPTGPEDQDPQRIAYARYLQARLMPADRHDQLGFDPAEYEQPPQFD